jgi:uncharacterized membrane protein YoaK (UPF0700 family)
MGRPKFLHVRENRLVDRSNPGGCPAQAASAVPGHAGMALPRPAELPVTALARPARHAVIVPRCATLIFVSTTPGGPAARRPGARAFLAEARQTLVADRNGRHGPLPPLLVAMTLVTGLVDAFSYLVLGHVFVANMTGNVVFLGFAVAGARGFSILSSLLALGSFAAGALAGGRIGARLGKHRGRLICCTAAGQAGLLAIAVCLAAVSGNPPSPGYRYGLTVTLAVAMGLQNAAARTLAVPDLTTTVLTLTITGLAADGAVAGGKGARAGRRLIAIAAMLAGAVAGAELVIRAAISYPLAIALVVVGAVAVTAWRASAGDPAWVHPQD